MEIYSSKEVKKKRPPGRQPKHTLEFMMMVARKVAEEGMTYREAGKVFGVSHGSIYAWLKCYRKKNWGNASKNKVVSQEIHHYRLEAQMKELKHEIAELYLENLMLKKMVRSVQSQTDKKQNSSIITSENLDQFRGGVK
jgi:transposase